MGDEILGDRRRALEEAFFASENDKLLRQLRQTDETRERKAALAAASGIADDAVLERLAALGLESGTLAALALVPLVAVAWADGKMEAPERAAVLAGAAEAGIGKESPAHALLGRWLQEPLPATLIPAWTAYTGALAASLDAPGRAALRTDLLGRARRVAEAAGGFLGIGGKVSAAEEAMLKRLESAFAS